MIFNFFLFLHILAGTIGLVIGPISMYAPKKKGLHTKIGKIYFYAMALVCLSAVSLSILHWQTSWWFLFVSAFSFSFAWRGYQAVKNRHKGWIRHHISGMLGSYIAMSTALLVVNSSRISQYAELPNYIYWMLPTIIGTPFVALVIRKYIR